MIRQRPELWSPTDHHFFEISLVADPPNPQAVVWRLHCDACGESFASKHPDNGCKLGDLFSVMEE